MASFFACRTKYPWRATSGFYTHGVEEGTELIHPLQGEFAKRAAAAEEMMILEGIGVAGGLPASDFPLHSAEGVRDVALVPLHVRGETLGALLVGYRAAHAFTIEEKNCWKMAAMAALALDNARLLENVGTAKKVWERLSTHS